LLLVLGPDGLAAASAPVSAAVEAAGSAWARVPVQIGAAMAALGALLALIAGVGRTTLAMARENDLPRWLSAVHPRFQVPYRAELCVGATVCLLVLVTDLRQVIGFSSFGVLVYYLIANLAAYTQGGDARRYPRWLQVVGVAGCALLALTLPWSSVLVGAAVLLIGMALRFGRRLAQSRPGASGR
ncbi:MAG TPA: amino acid permease, partial [Microlunatus sp.]|nr:amino acid permease [Microlunatus sp.]